MNSGDFSIGSKVWPGTSKLIEEMGELNQVIGKIIAIAGRTDHWDGDLRPKLIEEIGDVMAAIEFFNKHNLNPSERRATMKRACDKIELFEKWHGEEK